MNIGNGKILDDYMDHTDEVTERLTNMENKQQTTTLPNYTKEKKYPERHGC